MQKPPIIEQIEKIWGKDFILHPATAHPTLLSGVMAFKEGQPKYALDEQGRLIGLNLATTRLDNERWQEVVHLLEEHEVRLQALNLSDNQLTELKLPTNMRELFTLDFSSNKIIEFSPPAGMNNLSDINLFENPLKSPPPDVVKQGKSEILKWLKAANKRPVLEAKVMFIGDSNYGKTHLIEMLRHKKIRENTTIETTHGIERKRLTDAESAEGPIRLNVWDLGGQQYMRSTHQFFFTERTLYVLVTVARRERKDLNHWLKLVQRIGKDAPVLVVINKTDLDEGDIDREPLLREYSNIVGFVRTAINDCPARGVNALDTINELEKNIHRIISNKELMPSVFVRQRQEWFTVKNELEAMKEDYISYEDYQRRPHIRDLPKEEQDQTLRQLTSLGTVVSFLDVYRLKNTNVINPRWLLDGIYRLLNDHKIKKERQGLFRFADLARLLDQRRYPDQKYPFLVDLMQEFKLCYPLTCFKNTCEPAWLLPDLFTDIEPPDVWPHVNTMRFRLNYNSPPDLFITQFIVDRYASIVDEKRWRSGVVVTDGTCQAIIRRSFKYDHIEIEVAGPKNMRRGYLQFLLTVFGDLHKPFELEVQKELPFEGEWLN
ncbi:MAG: COR domain-containing protein, partial [Candidatus Electrothrix sp.]